MALIVVANAKGGVGKSTVASNLAGYLARQGLRVMLGDSDRQRSAAAWLARRPPSLPSIEGWAGEGQQLKSPKGISHAVLDTPAGLHGKPLRALAGLASHVVLPLQPSLFDAEATLPFVQELRELAPKARLLVVLNRVREHTLASQQVEDYLAAAGIAPVARLRDTQTYVQLAARGLSLWDVAPSRVERDIPLWQPLLDEVMA